MYSSKSKNAVEFIDDDEILATLDYAEKNKNNKPLLTEIINKAKNCGGLDYKEATALLLCEDKEINDEIFKTAHDIKQKIYGNRIVMFAPLYLSNYCVNGCLYCSYHHSNCHMERRKLTRRL